jgi:hypothetical protein
MKQTTCRLILSASLLFSFSTHAGGPIDYPDGYRTWTHIKTMTLHKGHPLENPFLGIHHIYGNEQGVQGVKSGQFDAGAVLVFDLLEYETAENASTEGDRVLLGVMVKDSDRYAATGGWGFEGFAGDSRTERLVDDGGESCFSCHASRKAYDYVYTRWRD